MTDQTIPAEEVRELVRAYSEYENPQTLLQALQSLLPTPPQPTTGLLGRWAKHPEYGDVLCVWDRPDEDGCVFVRWVGEKESGASDGIYAPLASLTFPEQTTRPEDVPAGEAWRIRDKRGTEFNAVKAPRGYYSESDKGFVYDWLVCDEGQEGAAYNSVAIDLVAPLSPERPEDDLQAKYDELETKYREAQERIKALEKASAPLTVTDVSEYNALPEGSVVAEPGDYVLQKGISGTWWEAFDDKRFTSAEISGTTRTVFRYGWGDEQPTWRIEHDHTKLREGEYIIDIDGDDGAVTHEWRGRWDTDGEAYGAPPFAPFIVFPSKDAATPEAIAEAKKTRDKETEE